MTRPSNPGLIKKIMDVVAEELQTKSIAELTMRGIAERSGVTATTIYYYFPSKDELLDAIKYSSIDELDDYILSCIDAENSGDVDETIETVVRALIEWFVHHPALTDLIFEKLPPKVDLDENVTLERFYRSPMAIMEILAKETGGERGDGRNYSLDITICMGMIYGVFKMYLNKRTLPQFWDDIETLTRRMVEVIKAILLPRG